MTKNTEKNMHIVKLDREQVAAALALFSKQAINLTLNKVKRQNYSKKELDKYLFLIGAIQAGSEYLWNEMGEKAILTDFEEPTGEQALTSIFDEIKNSIE